MTGDESGDGRAGCVERECQARQDSSALFSLAAARARSLARLLLRFSSPRLVSSCLPSPAGRCCCSFSTLKALVLALSSTRVRQISSSPPGSTSFSTYISIITILLPLPPLLYSYYSPSIAVK
ncbi:hypothetical protein Mapa_015330 [Marchantia paleacea]|nr:hypothetical protein Mapa_015330 [Marchantia paleacea]